MTNNSDSSKPTKPTFFVEPEFEGIYGTYRITDSDKIEVQRYRLAVLSCGMSFSFGLSHWVWIGPNWAWLWLIPMAISLGLALKWVHIYLLPLQRALQILWALGCFGGLVLAWNQGVGRMLSSLALEAKWTFAIGPFFAALTGLGFKEFFCFRRPEAVGLTLLVPIALLGHLTGIIKGTGVMGLLIFSAFLLLVLAIRKFGVDAAADVGDKSIFDYLDKQKAIKSL